MKIEQPPKPQSFCNGSHLVEAIREALKKEKSVTFRLDVKFRDTVEVCEYYDPEYEFTAKMKGKSPFTRFFAQIFNRFKKFKNTTGRVLQDRTFVTVPLNSC